MRMREVEPRLPLVALTNYDFLQVDQPGASPWLGGIDIDDFDDDLVAAADSFGASAISPVHGFPQDGKVTDPAYRPYVTEQMVDRAHAAGLEVVPWTVDDRPTMAVSDGRRRRRPDHRLPRPAARPDGRPRPAAPPCRTRRRVAPRFGRSTAPTLTTTTSTRGRCTTRSTHGFTSVEADVWLVDGELLVAHDREDVDPGRTLESLYLDPLADRVRAEGGAVYRGWDGTSSCSSTSRARPCRPIAAVEPGAARVPRLMTVVRRRTGCTSGAVTAVISGNRDLPLMQSQRVRYAGYDGRLSDLGGGLSAADDAAGQRQLDQALHLAGRRPDARGRARQAARPRGPRPRGRLPGPLLGHPRRRRSPARDAVWRELLAADVDHINTDDLAGLQAFLLAFDR